MSRKIVGFKMEGLDLVLANMDRISDEVDRRLRQTLTEASLWVEESAKDLAPHESGDLEADISAKPVKRTATGYETEVGSNKDYAARRHEEEPRMGTFPKYLGAGQKVDVYYINGRGLSTRSKPALGRYLPGRKFLENALKYNKKKINQAIEDAVREVLGR
jgi:HK97 gp10 family phage protein